MGFESRASSVNRTRWGQAGAWGLFVAVLLLLPGEAIPAAPWWLPRSFDGWLDCLAHALLFFGQAWLVLRAAGAGTSKRTTTALLIAVLAYALLLELAQIPVPGRSFQVVDMAFAAIGIGAACLLGRNFAARSD